MKILILFLSLSFAYINFSQDSFDAQILVKNFDKLAINNVEVQFYDTSEVYISKGITDEAGQFMMTMKPGKYIIRLVINGEQKKERTINLPVLEGNKIYNKVRIFVLYEERKQFTLENLLFENNSSIILESSYPILDRLIEFLNYEEHSKFEISGHTDNVGSDLTNLELSENRAKSVVTYLINNGIDGKRLIAKGYGESLPISDNNTEEGRALNRRTEIKRLD